jgi:hypothetical protein
VDRRCYFDRWYGPYDNLMRILILLVVFLFPAETFSRDNVINIKIGNPFRVSLLVEVKADHDYRRNRYQFYQRIKIPARSTIQLHLPRLTEVEIWALEYHLFGS